MANTDSQTNHENAALLQIRAAESQIRIISASVLEYARATGHAAMEGKLFESIADDCIKASENISKLAEENRAFNADVALHALSSALVVTSKAAEVVSGFDQRHAISATLAHAVTGAVSQAQQTLEQAKGRVTSLSESITARVPSSVTAAYASLQETVAVAEQAAGSDLRRATEEVGRSLQSLRDAPMTEKPVVAAMEALHLARSALSAVGDRVSSAAAAAKVRALGAVGEAISALEAAKTRVLPQAPASSAGGFLSYAASLASSVVTTAVHKAAELDVSYGISKRLQDIDGEFGVTGKVQNLVTKAQTTAATIDSKYNVTEKVQGGAKIALDLAEKVKVVDERITGGKGVALAKAAGTAATKLAGDGVDYARFLAQDYESTKANLTGGAGSSPNTAGYNALPADEQAAEQAPSSQVVEALPLEPAATQAEEIAL